MDSRSLWSIVRSDWKWIVAGCILSFALANLVLFGWPNVWPQSVYRPYVYAGDGLSIEWLVQRAVEGWIFDNPRSGFPFNSNFLDYPGSDAGNYLVYKALGILFGSGIAAVNLHFLISFPVVFLVAFAVLRAFRIRELYAACFALLFAFAPFHFARFFYGHMLYTWYFCVPLFFYYGYKITTGTLPFDLRSVGSIVATIAIIAALSSFGVYYAFFGAMVLVVCGLYGSVKHSGIRPLVTSAVMSAALFIGVAANLAPNIIDRSIRGVNPEVAVRVPMEAEIYSLKTVHLLLPQPDHRISRLGDFTKNYQHTFPLSNTNSSIGVVGVLGLAAIMISLLAFLGGKVADQRIGFAAVVVLAVLMIAAPGGFSVMFAMFVTPIIRGWDRIAIFVNFGCLLALAVALESSIWLSRLRAKYVPAVLAGLIALVGFLDQTPTSYRSTIDYAFARYETDAGFIKKIEANLPPGSAVYQLPYFEFPEMAPKHQLSVYDLASGFINSKALRWSFGGMKGREGDLYFRALSQESPGRQLAGVQKLGFSGIYIDRRGFADRGEALIGEFTRLVGAPALMRDDGNVAFFRIYPTGQIQNTGR